jgi:hypothetical protein
MRLAALCAGVALALPALAAAQAAYTAQERRVESASHSDLWLWEQGTNPLPPDLDPPAATPMADHADALAAPGFGPFSASASSASPPAAGSAAPAGSSSAWQTSSLAPGGVTASGSFSTAGDAEVVDAPTLAALNALLLPPVPYILGLLGGTESGASGLEVEFEVGVPTPYHITGSLTLAPGFVGQIPHPASGSGRIELTGPSGSVELLDVPFGCGCTQELDAQGVLAPGSYTLRADVSGGTNVHCDLNGCIDRTMSGSFELELALTAPVVPGPSRAWLSLLGVALAATAAHAVRRR